VSDAPQRVIITGGTKDITPSDQPAFQGKPSFAQRLLQFAITLAPNQQTNQPTSFAGTGSDTVTLKGFRASVRIGNYGSYAGATADVKIYGMRKQTMNELSALGQVFNLIAKNSIIISAGDATGLTPVFGGTINIAIPDYNAAPMVPFIMQCQTGYFSTIVPAAASSFPQPSDVATIMSGFANTLGLAFENNGVTVQLPPSYFPGDVRQQIKRCADAANITAEIVDAGTRLAIWPKGSWRTSKAGQNIPLVSPTTGMIGYPTLSPNGYMIVSSVFNPQVSFGSLIKVQSEEVPLANNTWIVNRLDLELDSLVPKGQWKSTAYCFPQNLSAPPPPATGSVGAQ
jgi:hypothetical protein